MIYHLWVALKETITALLNADFTLDASRCESVHSIILIGSLQNSLRSSSRVFWFFGSLLTETKTGLFKKLNRKSVGKILHSRFSRCSSLIRTQQTMHTSPTNLEVNCFPGRKCEASSLVTTYLFECIWRVTRK